jgi:hypothetical protein
MIVLLSSATLWNKTSIWFFKTSPVYWGVVTHQF